VGEPGKFAQRGCRHGRAAKTLEMRLACPIHAAAAGSIHPERCSNSL